MVFVVISIAQLVVILGLIALYASTETQLAKTFTKNAELRIANDLLRNDN